VNWLDKYGITTLPEQGTCDGPLLIAGSGRCVWEDARECFEGFYEGAVMCLNDMGMHWPLPFQHWYSNDWRMLPKWFDARRPRYRMEIDDLIRLHTTTDIPNATIWPWPGHGSSALNAVYTGLALGYDPITLCGVPLDDSGHYFDPPYETSPHAKTNFHREGTLKPWRQFAPYVKGKVFSMSGNSREILGDPSSYSPSEDRVLAL
jgi:hypothetical protein